MREDAASAGRKDRRFPHHPLEAMLRSTPSPGCGRTSTTWAMLSERYWSLRVLSATASRRRARRREGRCRRGDMAWRRAQRGRKRWQRADMLPIRSRSWSSWRRWWREEMFPNRSRMRWRRWRQR
ncbi:hypothetical protein PVAP13_9KG011800 [Panicum virgatum]|uniref:Uncharacterized protein n=1 Tax=Panicum virgatum TaxID=38727 RepID=A0A8T0N651_PANVG|nr:hypothetical protein PVAP13_9KG011800 [Panicum virgatum]